MNLFRVCLYVLFGILFWRISSGADFRRENRFGVEAVFSDSVTEEEISRFFDAFLKAKTFLARKLSPLPAENPVFYIQEKPGQGGIPLWVGGWYTRNRIFLQPVRVLWGKNLLDSVVLIEYAHFIIDRHTGFLCPPWLHETLALYYARLMQSGARPGKKPADSRFASFDFFIQSQKHLASYPRSRDFFMLAEGYALFLENHCGSDFFPSLLKTISRKIPWQQAFLQTCSQKPEQLYEKYFSFLP